MLYVYSIPKDAKNSSALCVGPVCIIIRHCHFVRAHFADKVICCDDPSPLQFLFILFILAHQLFVHVPLVTNYNTITDHINALR